MNIAVIFYGQLRWNELANKTFQENVLPVFANHKVMYFSYFCNDNNLNDFQQLYAPSTIIIEPDLPLIEIKKELRNTINKISDNLPKQLLSLYKSFQLLEQYQIKHNMKFDLYIKTRTDLVCFDRINLDKFNSNSVYLGYTNQPLKKYAQDLTLFTRSFENFKHICEMGFALDEIIKNLEQKELRNLYYHEDILANFMINRNIDSQFHNFNIQLARRYD